MRFAELVDENDRLRSIYFVLQSTVNNAGNSRLLIYSMFEPIETLSVFVGFVRICVLSDSKLLYAKRPISIG